MYNTPNSIIVSDIVNYVGQNGWGNLGWYVGIATNPRDRLFSDHNVSEPNDYWIFRKANSESEARATEEKLLETMGFKGGVGGGVSPQYVYAYRVTNTTVE